MGFFDKKAGGNPATPTERENPLAATSREADLTLREESRRDSEQTHANRRAQIVDAESGDMFVLTRQLATRGAEADIYIAQYKSDQRVVKLYRHGLDPKQEIMERYERVSRECPHHIVQVFKIGKDRQTGRWYELLEYIPNGSVADALNDGIKFDFPSFARELGGAVHALHEHGIVHRDLKPANILIRSYDPLDLVLTDFGISSVLDGASIRETNQKGLTTMYAAPEELSGLLVSKPADWWACGMIFYELLTGVHPFKGLTDTRILYLLSTQGVEIDEALPEREKQLLAGLLTKNDKYRWGWPQIEGWLDGKTDIPVYHEKSEGTTSVQPFVFDGKPYSSLHELALAFARNFHNWDLARGMLARGNVSKWLQNTNQFDDEAVIADKIACNDPDLYLFKFIREYAPELPFTIFGSLVTPENLLAWLQGKPGKSGKKILDIFRNGKIRDYLLFLPKKVKGEILPVLGKADWSRDMVLPLTALLFPDQFYWGPRGKPSETRDLLKFAQNHPGLLSLEAWQGMRGPDIVIPPDADALFRNGEYEKAIALLENGIKNGQLLYLTDTQNISPDNVFNGSQQDYNLELGRRNGLDNATLANIKKLRELVEKLRNGDSRFGTVAQECNAVQSWLDGIQSGQIAWQPAAINTLKRIRHDLYLLSGGFSAVRSFRLFLEYIVVPALLLYGAYFCMTSLSFDTNNWVDSGPYKIVKIGLYLLAVIFCGGLGAALGGSSSEGVGGSIGIAFGLVIGYIFSSGLEMLVPQLGSLFVGLLAFGTFLLAFAYLIFLYTRQSARNMNWGRGIIRDLQKQILNLPR